MNFCAIYFKGAIFMWHSFHFKSMVNYCSYSSCDNYGNFVNNEHIPYTKFQLITHGFNPMSNRSLGSPKYVVLRSLCRWVNETYKAIHKSNLYLLFVIVLGLTLTTNIHRCPPVYLIIVPTHISHTRCSYRMEIFLILIIYRHYEGFLCYQWGMLCRE